MPKKKVKINYSLTKQERKRINKALKRHGQVVREYIPGKLYIYE